MLYQAGQGTGRLFGPRTSLSTNLSPILVLIVLLQISVVPGTGVLYQT